ncbi:MAG: hypothetical protein IPG01_10265 [Chitinophagaceae bacterium]|nr:hypothetical protein [Chitinophagaceae bacterium]
MRKEKQINPALGDLVFIAKDHVVIVLFGAQRSQSAQRKIPQSGSGNFGPMPVSFRRLFLS